MRIHVPFHSFDSYLVEKPQWKRGRDRKHPRSTTQHNEKPRKYPKAPEKWDGNPHFRFYDVTSGDVNQFHSFDS
jgi:hypothetical protein